MPSGLLMLNQQALMRRRQYLTSVICDLKCFCLRYPPPNETSLGGYRIPLGNVLHNRLFNDKKILSLPPS